jgi:hypothetical protein
VNSPLEIRKVVVGIILSILWVCVFLFLPSSLVIDWAGDASGALTPFKPIVIVIGLLVIVFYHIFYRSSTETTKLSLSAVLTICWLALILFYPFKDPNNAYAGAVGFFTLIGGLGVCVLWVRYFSDEIFA